MKQDLMTKPRYYKVSASPFESELLRHRFLLSELKPRQQDFDWKMFLGEKVVQLTVLEL